MHKDNFVNSMKIFYVAVSVDHDGTQGLIAMVNKEGIIPCINSLVGPSEEDLKAIKKYCQEASDSSGRAVKIIKFTNPQIIEEYLPGKPNES